MVNILIFYYKFDIFVRWNLYHQAPIVKLPNPLMDLFNQNIMLYAK